MDAIEFVKKFGIDRVKLDLSIVDNHGYNSLFTEDFSKQLKQIVEAFDLVEYCNGLEDAKELLDEIDSERWVYNLYTNTVISFEYAPSEDMCIRYDVLKLAIELLEKCNES